MIRGLDLRLPSSHINPVYEMFKNISLDDTDVYVYDEEIIIKRSTRTFPIGGDYHFPEGKVSGAQFLHAIGSSNYDDLYAIRISVQIYPSGSSKQDIVTYEDFLNSECNIIFLLCDVDYAEIYVKSESHLLQFIKNADRIGCKAIEIKTDLNDGRTRMSVC